MQKHRFIGLIIAGTVLGAVACNDSGLDPNAHRADPRSAFDRAADLSRGPRTADFDITPDGGMIDIGGVFTLNVPANAVCDPSSSSYGAGHWDEDCDAAGAAVHVRAKLYRVNNRLFINFTPSIRFAPTAVVTISTNALYPFLVGRPDLARDASRLRFIGILYSPDEGAPSVDEVSDLGDASLVTHVDLRTGRVWRRIKHFSGYNVLSGLECNPDDGDPDCIPVTIDGGGH